MKILICITLKVLCFIIAGYCFVGGNFIPFGLQDASFLSDVYRPFLNNDVFTRLLMAIAMYTVALFLLPLLYKLADHLSECTRFNTAMMIKEG